MKREKMELIVLAILIIIGIFITFYNFVYVVDMDRIQSIRSELETNRQKLEKLKNKQGEEEAYILKLQNINSEIRNTEKKVPYTKDIPGLIVGIYYMLVDNGLTGESVAFSTINEADTYNFYNISFEVMGGKRDVNEFITKLKDFQREISISSIEFSMEDRLSLKAKIVLKVYLMKDKNTHNEALNYDFMEGKYGSFQSAFEMFNNPTMNAQTKNSETNKSEVFLNTDNSEHQNEITQTAPEPSDNGTLIQDNPGSSSNNVRFQDEDGGANP